MIPFLISGIFAALFVVIAEFGIISTGTLFDINLSYWEPGVDEIQQSIFLLSISLLAAAEEIVKFAVIRKQLSSIGARATLLPSIAFGTGFIIIELGLLFISGQIISDSVLPALGIGAIHLLTSITYGLIPTPSPMIKRLAILFVGISSHAFYNIFLALL